jgi:hypothetical protein
MTGPAFMNYLKDYGVRLTDSLYCASLVSTLAFSGAMLLLGVVAAAVATGAVNVPEFHPK